MICKSTKELLAEIKKYMDLNDISMKELAINMGKQQQNISQYFINGNPKCSTIFEICNALNAKLDINIISKSDTSK